MLRHVAVFVFSPEFSRDGLDDWIERIRDLAFVVPEVRAMSVGTNTVPGENAWEVAIVADFDDRAGLEAYNVHPAHRRVLELSAPVKRRLAVVDFEV